MTPLNKPVVRRSGAVSGGRRLIVSLEPGDVIGIRPAGCRRTEYMPVLAAYTWAVKARVLAERAAKRKKGGG